MVSDPTFRNYNPQQAQQYAGCRPAYPQILYERIYSEHARTGGGFGLVVDVGCGPGSATRDLAPAFERAIGTDPGEEMIKVARDHGGKTKAGEDINYEVCEAERIAHVPRVPVGGVDMITAATAAHWFGAKFWPQAAKLLRPGGTVVLWITSLYYPHPGMPYAADVDKARHRFENQILIPYAQPGNLVAHNMYDDLMLPWEADPAQKEFPREMFRRYDWDRNGVLSDGQDFLGASSEVPLDYLDRLMGTASAVTRWREAHPDLANTDRDCVVEHVRQLRSVLQDKRLWAGRATSLLIFKRT